MNTVVQEPIQLKTEKVEKLKTSIIIEDQTGTQYTFVLDQDKSFKSMFIAYAKCLGVQKSALRFIYDGERIDEELSVDKYNKAYPEDKITDGTVFQSLAEAVGGY